MTASYNEMDEELLPAHKRRVGRMQSLHEFQARVNRQSSNDSYVDMSALDRSKSDGTDSESHEPEFKRTVSRRSTGSLFGNIYRKHNNLSAFYQRQLHVLSFLILLGVIAGPLGYSIRWVYGRLLALREYLVRLDVSYGMKYALWTSHTIGFTVLGVLFTRLSPVAAGSGVSQMKSVLTGVDPRMYLPGYFDFITLVAKVLGLICSVGAGLVVGTEGAFIHIMSIITNALLCSRLYQSFSERLSARLQLLAAACAVGVSSTFSSPIGGVLFSMEVTSTYYLISNYMKAFISSVSGALMLYLTLSIANSTSKDPRTAVLATSFPIDAYKDWEIPLFLLMGAIIGVMATLTMWMIRKIAEGRRKWRASDNPTIRFLVNWIDPVVVAALVATCTFLPGKFSRNTMMAELVQLFTEKDLPEHWKEISLFYALAMLSMTHMTLLPLCITLRIPTGVWLPSFIIGAAFGRLVGEALNTISPSMTVLPGVYSLAGAAAFAGATTRTVSAAVIALEITGAMRLMLPIFCAVLTAIGVANMWKEQSVYDTLLVVSGLPYLPLLDFDTGLVAGDIVEPLLVYLTKKTTVARILLALYRMPDQDLPIVRSESCMTLLGTISSAHAKKLVRQYYTTHDLDNVEVDLGEEEMPKSTGKFSLSSLSGLFSRNRAGGLNGYASYDQMYSVLSSTLHGQATTNTLGVKVPYTPFLMDDERMLALMSEGWSQAKRELLNDPIKITHENVCVIRPMAMTISSATSLEDLHMVFTMLRCDHCFVCDQGALVGVVTTKALLEAGRYLSAHKA